MRAAIYARKSTDEPGVSAEAKSVARQIESARRLARGRGWTVADEHLFIDDGISGAEFERRPALQALVRALKPSPPFDVLIISEASRIGGEAIETSRTVRTIIRAGVQIFCYLDEREIRLDTPIDKMLLSLHGFKDESERHAASLRSADKARQLASAGRVTGGRVFGYRNVDHVTGTGASGRPIRSHVDLEIREDEARIVVEIFESYASGHGYKAIAHALNARGVPTPRAQQGRARGWDPGTIRAVLYRETYRGELVFGRRKKRDADGQRIHSRAVSKRPASEWIRVPRRELRIVPPARVERVDARLRLVSKLGKKRGARRHADRPPGRREAASPERRDSRLPVWRALSGGERLLLVQPSPLKGFVRLLEQSETAGREN